MTALTGFLPDYLRTAAADANGDLESLRGAPMAAISSITFENIDPDVKDPAKRYEALRYRATLAATQRYADAGVPQIVMFGTTSYYTVPAELRKHGAIAVPTPRNGLATPYLDAALLVRAYSGSATSVLKAEGDKPFDDESLEAIADRLRAGCDVVVGDRTTASMESMAPVQQRTEALLDSIIAALLGIPHGASSGVQAYSPAGLQYFLGYEELLGDLGNNWKYLVSTPALATIRGGSVTGVPVNVLYDEGMVAAETEAMSLKRLEQLLLMLEGSLQVAGLLYGDEHEYTAPSPERMALAEAALTALRKKAAA